MRKNGIKYVIFDWGDTIGRGGQRKTFLYSPSIKRRFTALKPDSISTLKYLKRKGYRLAIVSNTGYPRDDMERALKKTKMDKLFDFAVYSNDPGMTQLGVTTRAMCSKPCDRIFKTAIKLARRFIPRIKPHQMLYVGNNFTADVIGAKDHMLTCYMTNGEILSMIIAAHSKHSADYVIDHMNDLKSIL